VPDPLYRTLVWLDYRLAVVFTVGLPLVLLLWAALRREGAMVRLMTIYWKVASLLAITVLLLVDARPLGYALGVLAQLLMVASVWFWVDLNEELADLPPWRPLPLTVRTWRWALSVLGLLGAALSASALSCLWGQLDRPVCQVWLEAPPEAPSPGRQVVRLRLRGRSHSDPHGVHRLCGSGGLCGGSAAVAAGALPPARPGGWRILMTGDLVGQLEAISRSRPDRVLRLRGTLPLPASQDPAAQDPSGQEPFELLIFRGFSSSVTHPTAFDPDQAALPAGAELESADLLQGPLNPRDEQLLAGPLRPDVLLDPQAWL